MDDRHGRLAALRGALYDAGALDASGRGARRTETRDWLKRLNRTLADLESVCCRIWVCCSALALGREAACGEDDRGSPACC